MKLLLAMNRSQAMLALFEGLRSAGVATEAAIVVDTAVEHDRFLSRGVPEGVRLVCQESLCAPLDDASATMAWRDLLAYERSSLFGAAMRWVYGTRGMVARSARGIFFHEGTHYARREAEPLVSACWWRSRCLFDELAPDLVLLEGVANLPQFAFAEFAYARGIPSLFLVPSRVGSWMTIATSPRDDASLARERHQALREGATPGAEAVAVVDRLIERVRGGTVELHDAARVAPAKLSARRALGRIAARVAGRTPATSRSTLIRQPPDAALVDGAARTLLRRRLLRSTFAFDDLPRDRPYVLMPFHSEPETALSLNAPHITNQAELACAMAFALPFDHCLVVKDHPRMFGLRSIAYYSRMKRRSFNLLVVDPESNGVRATAGAACVATVAGTLGLEALLLGIPVLLFGHALYQGVTGVVRTGMTQRLPWDVRAALDLTKTSPNIARDAKLFAMALIESSAQVPWHTAIKERPQDYDYGGPEFMRFTRLVEAAIRRKPAAPYRDV